MAEGKPWKNLTIERKGSKLNLRHPIFPGPMAGAFEPPYRMMLHDIGIELSFTEMISARGTIEGSGKTLELAGWVPEKGYSGAQVFGSDANYVSGAAREMVRLGHDIIDLNAGCPKRKVLVQGSGGALLKEHERFVSIASSILDSVDVPVSVKTRSGFHVFEPNPFKKLLKDLESIGISMISIHGRTVRQGYRGSADRDVISQAASIVDIPVIASGDVRSLADVLDYFGRGASGVMVGRAMMGDPFFISRIISEDQDPFPSKSDDVERIFSMAARHLDLSIDYYGEKRGCMKFRSQLGWYVRSFKGRKPYMDRIHHASSKDDFTSLMTEILHEWKRQPGTC